VQNDILAIKLNSFVSIEKRTRDYFDPSKDGKIAKDRPMTKTTLARH
jgi:hypothetical protein